MSASLVVRKLPAAATHPSSSAVAAGVGGSPLPPSRPEPSKSLRRHLVPPGRVLPCPAASVGASVMSRRPPTGAAPPLPPRRPWRREVDRGGARARPFSGGAVLGPSPQPDGSGRCRRRLVRGTCTANAEWVLEPRAAPGCSRSTPGRPCARQTLSHCGSSPGIPVCRSSSIYMWAYAVEIIFAPAASKNSNIIRPHMGLRVEARLWTSECKCKGRG